ncbi:hypothetical protein [Roseateles amylovorans]|uniref:Uncharacterized protein n=1 Tax=Roseateles amylovorans TaxID=2978473 RepID=A0ABY6AZP0_9BURK|nr:hypothetical protein [Roseateles amylovorans]UXH77209.1 hypothetical protein N4261_19650 [Roseateles amylovorans]
MSQDQDRPPTCSADTGVDRDGQRDPARSAQAAPFTHQERDRELDDPVRHRDAEPFCTNSAAIDFMPQR